MLFLLRKIRRKLISTDKKVVTYLIYAIGEILLVVIGILIAVSIDDWKDETDKKKIANSYLRQIQEELQGDIGRIDQLMKYYFYQKDSLLQLILRNQLTGASYKENPSLMWTISNYEPFHMNRKGYDNFLANFEQIPKEYESVINKLQNVYKNESDLESANSSMKLSTYEYGQYIRNRLPYYYLHEIYGTDSLLVHPSSGEILDFFVNDPTYKNFTYTYWVWLYNQHPIVATYQINAVQAYIAIDELLQPNSPSKMESFFIAQDSAAYTGIYGIYVAHDLSQMPLATADIIEILWHEQQLQITAPGQLNIPLLQLADSSYTVTGTERFLIKGDTLKVKVRSLYTYHLKQKNKQ